MIQIYKENELVIGLDGKARTWAEIEKYYLSHIDKLLKKKITIEAKKATINELKEVLHTLVVDFEKLILVKNKKDFSDFSAILLTNMSFIIESFYINIDRAALTAFFIDELKKNYTNQDVTVTDLISNLKSDKLYLDTKRLKDADLPDGSRKIIKELVKKYKESTSKVNIIIDSEIENLTKCFNQEKAKTIANEVLKILDYSETISGDFRHDFVNMLGIKACPYCNSQFIFTVEKINENGKTVKKAYCQLDHYYPKSKYPFFSVSLFNLIPVCANCNLTKSNNTGNEDEDESALELGIKNPYFYNMHENAKFEISLAKNVDALLNGDFRNLKVSFVSKNLDDKTKIDVQKHENTFAIESLYEHHRDQVAELFWKSQAYTPTHKKEIEMLFDNNTISKIGLNEADFNRFILGNYIDEKDFQLRPLSKLTYDISEELKFLQYQPLRTKLTYDIAEEMKLLQHLPLEPRKPKPPTPRVKVKKKWYQRLCRVLLIASKKLLIDWKNMRRNSHTTSPKN